MITIYDILQDNGVGCRLAGMSSRKGPQILLDECFSCGREHKLYANADTGQFFCFVCEAKGGAVALISGALGIPKREARALLKGETREPERIGIDAVEKLLADLRDIHVATPDEVKRLPMPEGFTLVNDGKRVIMPRYLKERSVTKAVAKYFKIGFTEKGICAGRVVFPVECNGYLTYVARAINDLLEPKYLNAEAFPQGKVMFNVPRTEGGWRGQRVIVVEGIFDALRLHALGFNATALFGKSASEDQIRLIRDFGASEVTVMLDSDASKQTNEVALRISHVTRASAAILEEGDPGDIQKRGDVLMLLATAKVPSRLSILEAAISPLKKHA